MAVPSNGSIWWRFHQMEPGLASLLVLALTILSMWILLVVWIKRSVHLPRGSFGTHDIHCILSVRREGSLLCRSPSGVFPFLGEVLLLRRCGKFVILGRTKSNRCNRIRSVSGLQRWFTSGERRDSVCAGDTEPRWGKEGVSSCMEVVKMWKTARRWRHVVCVFNRA